MVVMASRFSGKCKRCGKAIQLGQKIDWTRETGAVHLTQEECDAAPEYVKATKEARGPMRGPQPEDPDERLWVVQQLLTHPWKSSTSKKYEKLPHQYTLRQQWEKDDFETVAAYIQRIGYEKFFIGRVWVYYDIEEHQYWNCDGPISDTPLINRAVREKTLYD